MIYRPFLFIIPLMAFAGLGAQIENYVPDEFFTQSVRYAIELQNGNILIAGERGQRQIGKGVPYLSCLSPDLDLVWEQNFPELKDGTILQLLVEDERIFFSGWNWECDIPTYNEFYGFTQDGEQLDFINLRIEGGLPGYRRFSIIDNQTVCFNYVEDGSDDCLFIDLNSGDTLIITDPALPGDVDFNSGGIWPRDLVMLSDTSILTSGVGLQRYCFGSELLGGDRFVNCGFNGLEDTVVSLEVLEDGESVIMGSNHRIYRWNESIEMMSDLPEEHILHELITDEEQTTLLLQNSMEWVIRSYDPATLSLIGELSFPSVDGVIYERIVDLSDRYVLFGHHDRSVIFSSGSEDEYVFKEDVVITTVYKSADTSYENFIDIELIAVNTTYTSITDQEPPINQCPPLEQKVRICSDSISLTIRNNSDETLNELTVNVGTYPVCGGPDCYYVERYDTTISSLAIPSNLEGTLVIDPIDFSFQTQESFLYCLWITSPNNKLDLVPSNDRICPSPENYLEKPVTANEVGFESSAAFHYFNRFINVKDTQTTKRTNVTVYDASGKIVLQTSMLQNLQLNLRNGYYNAVFERNGKLMGQLPFIFH